MIVNGIIQDTRLEASGFTIAVAIGVPETPVIEITDRKTQGAGNVYELVAKLGVTKWEVLIGAACRINVEEGEAVAIGSLLLEEWYDLVDPAVETAEEFEGVEEVDYTNTPVG